jgi:5-hydroxyisourate hydrolase
MSGISTHVLDTARGCPAEGIGVLLEQRAATGWQQTGNGTTDADGRVASLLSARTKLQSGEYRLTFDIVPYFHKLSVRAFYPQVAITFYVDDPAQHYHVPLLLSPFGYSTYRGS